MKTLTTSPAGLAWLVPSPAQRQRFVKHGLPIPLRVPVRWVRTTSSGHALIQLPGALAQALALPSPFVTIPAHQLRPVTSVLLWSAARSTLRRSLGCIG
jgi:hypothetical protein